MVKAGRKKSRSRKFKKGFTLIEAILTIMLLGVGMVGVLTLFQNNVAKSNESEYTMIAAYLAQERLERFVQDKRYRGYNEMIGLGSNEDLAGIGYPGYTRTLTSAEVDPADLTTESSGSQYLKVTCAVTTPMGDSITLETLLTAWGG